MIPPSFAGPEKGSARSDNFWHRQLRLSKLTAARLGDLDEVKRIEAMQRQAQAKRAS